MKARKSLSKQLLLKKNSGVWVKKDSRLEWLILIDMKKKDDKATKVNVLENYVNSLQN